MIQVAGYSGTPLAKKLGLKPPLALVAIDAPSEYRAWLGEQLEQTTEDTIREIALPLGFVDIKVCAVSDVWSGLKLVVRKAARSP